MNFIFPFLMIFDSVGFMLSTGGAAYGIIMYLNFVFVSAFIGYTMGTAPIISFNYGAETYPELKNVSFSTIICTDHTDFLKDRWYLDLNARG